jgi:hypothetical protein
LSYFSVCLFLLVECVCNSCCTHRLAGYVCVCVCGCEWDVKGLVTERKDVLQTWLSCYFKRVNTGDLEELRQCGPVNPILNSLRNEHSVNVVAVFSLYRCFPNIFMRSAKMKTCCTVVCSCPSSLLQPRSCWILFTVAFKHDSQVSDQFSC